MLAQAKGQCLQVVRKQVKLHTGMEQFQKHHCNRAVNLGGFVRKDHLQALLKD